MQCDIEGLTRIVPNNSAFRKRNRKRESQRSAELGEPFAWQNLRAIGAPNQYLARTGRGRFRVTALMA